MDHAEVPPDISTTGAERRHPRLCLSGIDLRLGRTPGPIRLAVSPSASSRSRSARRAATRTCLVWRPERLRREGSSLSTSITASGLYSAELGIDASQMLGHVMAHELGHLLLPHGAHSLAGLMRRDGIAAQVEPATAGLLTFAPAEAALIRERLYASASRAYARE